MGPPQPAQVRGRVGGGRRRRSALGSASRPCQIRPEAVRTSCGAGRAGAGLVEALLRHLRADRGAEAAAVGHMAKYTSQTAARAPAWSKRWCGTSERTEEQRLRQLGGGGGLNTLPNRPTERLFFHHTSGGGDAWRSGSHTRKGARAPPRRSDARRACVRSCAVAPRRLSLRSSRSARRRSDPRCCRTAMRSAH
jgi:hypothetical protein